MVFSIDDEDVPGERVVDVADRVRVAERQPLHVGVKVFGEGAELFEHRAALHVRMLAIHQDADDGLGGARVIDDLPTPSIKEMDDTAIKTQRQQGRTQPPGWVWIPEILGDSGGSTGQGEREAHLLGKEDAV